MSFFNLKESIANAEKRLGQGQFEQSKRKRRSDIGQSRLPKALEAKLVALLSRHERPTVNALRQQLTSFCKRRGYRTPSRSRIYKAMQETHGPRYHIEQLPHDVRAALYNLPQEGNVPGHQLVFYALNYGNIRAVMYASGLPWLALYQAYRLGGWRPKSRGLLRAVMRVRRI